MNIKNYREVTAEPTNVDGLTMRWLITASHGATNFSMRLLELASSKSTPLHQHDSEHEVFVLVGLGHVETGEGEHVFPIREGSVIYISPNETHRFVNTGASKLRMIDVVMFPSRINK